RTTLVERQMQARDRPGEALHPGVEPLLRELGAAEALHVATRARFPGVWIQWDEAPRFEAFGADDDGTAWLGFQVSRARLDEALRARAQELGARLITGIGMDSPEIGADGSEVIGARLEDGRVLRAAMLIDASGAARWLSRRLGLQERTRSPRRSVRYGYVRGRCAARADAPSLVGDRVGWTWTARVAEDLYQWARVDFDDDAERSRDERPAELATLEPVGAARGADATWRVVERAAGPGWMIAGDAAANLDPASSKGVLKALLSGTLAGRTAVAILQRGGEAARGAAAYHAWLQDGFETEVAALAPMYARLGAAGYGE
ncbi:MAG: NAD(P)/FAD-dependent oxidoreductase, partial [Panacagrimonas sp.]